MQLQVPVRDRDRIDRIRIAVHVKEQDDVAGAIDHTEEVAINFRAVAVTAAARLISIFGARIESHVAVVRLVAVDAQHAPRAAIFDVVERRLRRLGSGRNTWYVAAIHDLDREALEVLLFLMRDVVPLSAFAGDGTAPRIHIAAKTVLRA